MPYEVAGLALHAHPAEPGRKVGRRKTAAQALDAGIGEVLPAAEHGHGLQPWLRRMRHPPARHEPYVRAGYLPVPVPAPKFAGGIDMLSEDHSLLRVAGAVGTAQDIGADFNRLAGIRVRELVEHFVGGGVLEESQCAAADRILAVAERTGPVDFRTLQVQDVVGALLTHLCIDPPHVPPGRILLPEARLNAQPGLQPAVPVVGRGEKPAPVGRARLDAQRGGQAKPSQPSEHCAPGQAERHS